MPLPLVLDAFERLAPFGRLLAELPEPGRRVAISGLVGSSDAVLVAALAEHRRRSSGKQPKASNP